MHGRPLVTLAVLLGAGTALAQLTPPPSSPVPAPGVVLWELHQVNVLEIELGGLAQARGGQVEVKSFGAHMVKAHTQLDAQGSDFARKQGLKISAPAQDSEHRADARAQAALKQKLQGLEGAEFDRVYLQAMADDHGKVLDKVKSWEAQTSHKALQKFLGDASNEVEEHKRQAGELLTKLGKSAALRLSPGRADP